MNGKRHSIPKRGQLCVMASVAMLGLLAAFLGSVSVSMAERLPGAVLTGKVVQAFHESPVSGAEIAADGVDGC